MAARIYLALVYGDKESVRNAITTSHQGTAGALNKLTAAIMHNPKTQFVAELAVSAFKSFTAGDVPNKLTDKDTGTHAN